MVALRLRRTNRLSLLPKPYRFYRTCDQTRFGTRRYDGANHFVRANDFVRRVVEHRTDCGHNCDLAVETTICRVQICRTVAFSRVRVGSILIRCPADCRICDRVSIAEFVPSVGPNRRKAYCFLPICQTRLKSNSNTSPPIHCVYINNSA